MKNKLHLHPPHWIDRFLQWRLPEEQFEEVQGDMHELYYQWIEEMGQKKANRMYLLNAFTFLRPLPKRADSLHKTNPYAQANSFIMFSNYLKVAFRNIVRQKIYSFINIAGLAAGMALAILIGLWIWDELTFNTYHQNYNRIARMMRQETMDGVRYTMKESPLALGKELSSSYGSDFTSIVIATGTMDGLVTYQNKDFTQKGSYMQAQAPQMLSLKLLKGSNDGLLDLHSIFLSETLSKKLFGEADPIDQVVKLNQTDVKVMGVYEDLPHNSDFRELSFIAPFDLYVATNEWVKQAEDNWGSNFVNIYVQIALHRNLNTISAKIKDIKLAHVSGEGAARKPVLFLQPMHKWHLYSDFENGLEVMSEGLKFILFYGIIGIFVLLLACINFTNLSTARSEKRAKEVGIRKTLGSMRWQLVGQFMSESLLTAALAATVAILLVYAALPALNEVASKEISILWTNPWFWLAIIAFICCTGTLAGSYPAFYLSAFEPINVLKGSFTTGRFAFLPRKILVVLQFTVSITLIIGVILVYEQISFTKDRPVGYAQDGLVMIPITSEDVAAKYKVLRNELEQANVISQMAQSASPLTSMWSTSSDLTWDGKDEVMVADFATLAITPEYGKTIGWQLVEGRDFSAELASDSSGMIINEAAVKVMGLTNPLGKTIRWKGAAKSYTILGVVKDMIMESPFKPSYPTVFFLQGGMNFFLIKIKPTVSASVALAKIEKVFKEVTPLAPFTFQFVDETYGARFATEERISVLASMFATLAVFISCIGLFGLASFTAGQRKKEIGVRKVLGASIFSVWRLLSKEFVSLVLISFLTASPIAYLLLSHWLANYEYRTEISWWIFALAGLGVLLLTLITVSYQTIKAAIANPAKSLRSE